jgi:PAS domain S-box-containing protein
VPFIPDRLGPKLGLFLAGMFAILGVSTAALIIFGFERTQNEATTSSREGLEQAGQRTLLDSAFIQAAFGQSQLEATAGFAQQASNYLVDVSERAQPTPLDPAVFAETESGLLYDARPERRSDLIIPAGTELTTEILQDAARSAILDDLFPTLLRGYTGQTRSPNYGAISIYYQGLNNVARIYPPVPDIDTLPLLDTDLNAATLSVGPEQNPTRRTIWSAPYEDTSGRGLVMSATVPVYDGGKFIGAIGVDFGLANLVALVEATRPTTNGFAFYIDSSGELLPTTAASVVRAEMSDPRNTEFGLIMEAIDAGRADVRRVEIAGRDMFVAHTPLQGVGGTLALAAPVDEVTQQAAAVENSIDEGGRRTLLFALVGLTTVFLLTLASAALLNRRLVLQPISEIVTGTRALAAGDLTQQIPVRSSDELGTLAESFNGMTDVLRERTDNLREREEQYRAIFEASSDGYVVTRVDDGVITDVNPAMCAMHGYTRDEMLRLHPTQFIHPDDHHLFADYVATVAAGGDYRCRARDVRKDGTLFHVEVLGTPVTYGGALHILGLVRDVTAQVEAERILEERVEDRTGELAALLQVSQSVAAALDVKSVASAILKELSKVSDYAGATLAGVEDDDMVIIDSWGPFSEEVVGGPTSRFPRKAIPIDFWEVMERGAPVIVDDVRADAALAKSYRRVFRPFLELPSFAQIRSWIAVPLVRQGHIVGMLTASHDEPDHFTEENARLILAAASQAAVAMENARLFEQTRERSRELTTLLDVAQNVASTIELQPLLNLILDQVGAVAPFYRAAFMVLDGEELEVLAVGTREGSADPDYVSQVGIRVRAAGSPIWERMMTGTPYIIDDVHGSSDEAHSYRTAVGDDISTTFKGMHGWMGVPVMLKDRAIGMLALGSDRVSFYNTQHARLARAVADQAAVAIENARLFEQTGRQSRESSALLQIANSMTSTLELYPLVRVILAQLHTVVDYTGSSVVIVNGDDLEILSSRVLDPPNTPEVRGLRYPLERHSETWQAFERGETVVIDDIHDSTTYAREYRNTIGEEGLKAPSFRMIRSWMAVPLAIKDEVIGILSMSRNEPRYFTPDHVRIATAVGKQAALAIENARLFTRAEERTEELATLLDVSSVVASTIELQPLLDLILEQIRRVAPYDGATFFTLQRDRLRAESFVTQEDPTMDLTTIGMEIPVAGSALWTRISAGETIILDDIYDDSPTAAALREIAGSALYTRFRRIKSWLGIPLMRGDRAIGLLALSGHTPGVFNITDARLARAVADRAALAIENARLFKEASDRTRELSALLDISKGIASTLDRGPLVAAIIEQLREIVDYNGASIMLKNDDRLEIIAYDRDAPLQAAGAQVPMSFPISNMAPLWSSMLQGRTVIVDDMRSDEAARDVLEQAVGTELMDGALRHDRAMLAVPLIVHDDVIGALTVSNAQPGHFNDDHARLVRAVADQAAVALENARLYEETSRRARETEALLRADAELFRSLSVDDVFQALCDVAVDVLGVSKCMVTTIEDESGRYTTRASRGVSQTSLAQIARVRERQPRRELGTMTAPIVTVDARRRLPELAGIFELEGIISTVDVPIRIDGHVRGDFALAFTSRHEAVLDEQRLYQALADRAAIAIQNAELYERSQQVASLEERQRLARELHDSVSQALYGIALGARTARTQLDRDPIKAVEPVEYVLSLAEAGLAEMRALIFELRPESLQTEGLVAAIEKHVASTRARYGLEVDAQLGAEPDVRLDVKEALYRVTQEALHNIVKHAQARHVHVHLQQEGGALLLHVRDDGKGFDPQGTYPGHVGLHSMRERVEKLSGSISIESAPGKGSRVNVRIPVNGASASQLSTAHA